MDPVSPKDRILAALHDLPENASIEDAIERLVSLASIDEGLADLDAGRSVPHAEVRRRFRV